ncbi:hypothetical protein RCL1_007509 [Eukaryota sp. TZLM3-RCL]
MSSDLFNAVDSTSLQLVDHFRSLSLSDQRFGASRNRLKSTFLSLIVSKTPESSPKPTSPSLSSPRTPRSPKVPLLDLSSVSSPSSPSRPAPPKSARLSHIEKLNQPFPVVDLSLSSRTTASTRSLVTYRPFIPPIVKERPLLKTLRQPMCVKKKRRLYRKILLLMLAVSAFKQKGMVAKLKRKRAMSAKVETKSRMNSTEDDDLLRPRSRVPSRQLRHSLFEAQALTRYVLDVDKVIKIKRQNQSEAEAKLRESDRQLSSTIARKYVAAVNGSPTNTPVVKSLKDVPLRLVPTPTPRGTTRGGTRRSIIEEVDPGWLNTMSEGLKSARTSRL